MPEVPAHYFIIAVIFSTVIVSIFFWIQKSKIIKHYIQANAQELKDIHGFIVTDKGFLS